MKKCGMNTNLKSTLNRIKVCNAILLFTDTMVNSRSLEITHLAYPLFQNFLAVSFNLVSFKVSLQRCVTMVILVENIFNLVRFQNCFHFTQYYSWL